MVICVPQNVAMNISVSNTQNDITTEINIKLMKILTTRRYSPWSYCILCSFVLSIIST